MCEDETSSSIDPLLSNNACACAPSYCNESIFFNLILNTEYENTKENCLIFLQNYSKHVILPKRDLFKNIINELTLSQFSKKEINNNNDESVYLIRIFIKKYSRYNIINALFDFISQNENQDSEIDNNNNITNDVINNEIINSAEATNDVSSNDKIENVDNKEINENIEMKEDNKENEEVNINQSGSVYSDNIKPRKRKDINLLKKKRKFDGNNNIVLKESGKKSKNKKQDDKKDINSDNEKKDKDKDKGKEKSNINIKKEKFIEENSISDEVKVKKEKDDFFNKSFCLDEDYKNKLRNRPKSINMKYSLKRKSQSPIPLQRKLRKPFSTSNTRGRNKKFLDEILSEKSTNNKSNINIVNKNEIFDLEGQVLRSHLIKINGSIVTYNMKKYYNNSTKKVEFVCNNKECKGKGIYYTDKKTFKETEKHNFKKIVHKVSFKHNLLKELLLKDDTCDGYQIIKNGKFIKDKKVVCLK